MVVAAAKAKTQQNSAKEREGNRMGLISTAEDNISLFKAVELLSLSLVRDKLPSTEATDFGGKLLKKESTSTSLTAINLFSLYSAILSPSFFSSVVLIKRQMMMAKQTKHSNQSRKKW